MEIYGIFAILILLLGIMISVIHLGNRQGERDAAILINSDNILNFMIAGLVLVDAFHAAQHELHSPASIDNHRH
jgi:hypothetical protein